MSIKLIALESVVVALSLTTSGLLVQKAQKKPANSKKLPSFTRVLLLEKTSETSANVSIGDLNGDGFPDLVLAKGRHWPLIDRVLLNDGHGSFTTAHDL